MAPSKSPQNLEHTMTTFSLKIILLRAKLITFPYLYIAMAIQNFKLSEIDKNNCSHMDPVLTKRMLFEF